MNGEIASIECPSAFAFPGTLPERKKWKHDRRVGRLEKLKNGILAVGHALERCAAHFKRNVKSRKISFWAGDGRHTACKDVHNGLAFTTGSVLHRMRLFGTKMFLTAIPLFLNADF
jgi:hypothetical protein